MHSTRYDPSLNRLIQGPGYFLKSLLEPSVCSVESRRCDDSTRNLGQFELKLEECS